MRSEMLSRGHCRFMAETEGIDSGSANRRRAAIEALAVFSLFLVLGSCSHTSEISRPYVVIAFTGVDLFIEGSETIEEVVVVRSGTLEFMKDEGGGYNYFKTIGAGSFSVRGLAFRYDGDTMVCEGKPLDFSRGGLLIRPDGTVIPTYVLPLLAR